LRQGAVIGSVLPLPFLRSSAPFFLKTFLAGLFICIFSPLLSMSYDNLEKILEKTFANSNNVRIFDPSNTMKCLGKTKKDENLQSNLQR